MLLASALTLVWLLRLNPASAPWLLAKLLALVVYIGLGVIALRPGQGKPLRAGAWAAALLTFGYIVSVAVTKRPAGFLAPLDAWAGP
ncbi:MAG TPA: SirB2 family protein [Rubrivivax sp.]|nr:SirB2 family protein [Rubrivivax sp.]